MPRLSLEIEARSCSSSAHRLARGATPSRSQSSLSASPPEEARFLRGTTDSQRKSSPLMMLARAVASASPACPKGPGGPAFMPTEGVSCRRQLGPGHRVADQQAVKQAQLRRATGRCERRSWPSSGSGGTASRPSCRREGVADRSGKCRASGRPSRRPAASSATGACHTADCDGDSVLAATPYATRRVSTVSTRPYSTASSAVRK